jgi:hypothetical protein
LMDFQLSIIFHCIIGQYSPRFLITMAGDTTLSLTTFGIMTQHKGDYYF